ncbi:hypothetical protein SKAU_G00318050 [Synaphobranchus kaupii]|uniref:Uncharacterized protein n=1 Tax=Synaphobranchus kaupii TaxID=118154 RepID=A0A9Q1ET11_SYNKA|nr:hypothetical protein SKAU_G00318050 [Synaphobranchus kaupii]
MAERVKRVSLPLGEKVQIVEELESTGVSQTIVAKKFGVSTSQVSRIMRDKARLLLQRERNFNQHRKRQRFAKEKHIDHKLLMWARQQLAEGVQVSCASLKQRATELAQAEGTTFTPSDSWITRWRDRHNIASRRRKQKNPERANSPAVVDWKATVLRHILESYSPANIFSAHEVGLWFRAIPERHRADWQPVRRRARDRITALLCANMAGTERQPLLVIGSTKQPRCFPPNLESLPVGYASDSKALMNSQLFQQWLQRWDRALRSSERRVCLLVTHCPAHPSTVALSNIQLKFLPSSSAHVIQPMAVGVSRVWKAHFRSRLFARIRATLQVEPGRSTEDVARNVSLLDALYLAEEAWSSVNAATIADCFHQGIFCRDEAAEVCEDTESLADVALPEGLTLEEFERYVDADSGLDATGIPSRPKQAQAIDGLQVVKVEASDEDSEDEVAPAPLTLPQQVQMVAHLRQLVQESAMHAALPLLWTVEAQVHANVHQARGPRNQRPRNSFSQ